MVNVVPLEKTDENYEFALAVKKEALGPYVIPHWGWNDEAQRRTHSDRWASCTFYGIVRDGASIGTVSIDDKADHVLFGEFYLFTKYQRQGVGSFVLSRVLREADAKGMPVRLRCLKWNPVVSLYKRHGFAVTGETETHYLMERRHDS